MSSASSPERGQCVPNTSQTVRSRWKHAFPSWSVRVQRVSDLRPRVCATQTVPLPAVQPMIIILIRELTSYVSCYNIAKRRNFTKLRISSHHLAIEKGRYTRLITPREQRFCNNCSELEKLLTCAPRRSIHLFQEIAILEFPTSYCFQNEAICDNKPTAAAGPVGNTRWRPVWRNKLLVLATGPCWLKNYNCPTIQITGQNRLKQMFTRLISSPTIIF